MKKTQQAPAKINLFLYMTGRREDGYHLLSSVMHTISLYDTITVEVEEASDGKSKVELLSDVWYLLKDPSKNTAVKAAELFLSKLAPKAYHVTVDLKKEIPSQAGLGGGSTDAATVLKILSEFFPGQVSNQQLHEIALQVGADVPFFLGGAAALCEGVGEILTPVAPVGGLPVLIMKPKEGVSTPVCYREFDEQGKRRILSAEEERIMDAFLHGGENENALDRVSKAKSVFGNDLLAPSLSQVPSIGDAVPLMEEYGAVYACMSGSGSAVFGLFEKESDIDRLLSSEKARSLKQDGWIFKKAVTLDD
ncbi:MAG: 4-(cytidine 5'-diphospho)-2-C-methyl-D-erythritol kinase [Clostridiales bacterium]|nr:4-(cytidine 5'-diphospho)-2-C-methyl-D-erythritol kinase [Clostridiales bacterium]